MRSSPLLPSWTMAKLSGDYVFRLLQSMPESEKDKFASLRAPRLTPPMVLHRPPLQHRPQPYRPTKRSQLRRPRSRRCHLLPDLLSLPTRCLRKIMVQLQGLQPQQAPAGLLPRRPLQQPRRLVPKREQCHRSSRHQDPRPITPPLLRRLQLLLQHRRDFQPRPLLWRPRVQWTLLRRPSLLRQQPSPRPTHPHLCLTRQAPGHLRVPHARPLLRRKTPLPRPRVPAATRRVCSRFGNAHCQATFADRSSTYHGTHLCRDCKRAQGREQAAQQVEQEYQRSQAASTPASWPTSQGSSSWGNSWYGQGWDDPHWEDNSWDGPAWQQDSGWNHSWN